MKRLGVEPTFLPDLLYLYGAAYRDQILGREPAESILPMGACVKAGIRFSLHTDAPVSPAGPLRLVQIAVRPPLRNRQFGDRRRPGDKRR